MGALFDREAGRSDAEFTLVDELTAISGPETALSQSARRELSSMNNRQNVVEVDIA
jgi:hypothetical protein